MESLILNTAFISLTPANALARLAFSNLHEEIMDLKQSNQTDGAQEAHRRMMIEPDQICDESVARLRSVLAYDSDGEASDTTTELETDDKKLRGRVWVGYYLLSLDHKPAEPEWGWSVGKGTDGKTLPDLLLCTRSFAKEHNIMIKNPHARFNFSRENMGFYIMRCSRSASVLLKVDVNNVTNHPYHLNSNATISFDKLEYHLQWMEHSRTDGFKNQRRLHAVGTFGEQALANLDFEMPTPFPNQIQLGKWTLGEALGAGTFGRVFFASDTSGDTAAIKMMERTSENCALIDEEIKTMKAVTDLARKSRDSELVMHMVDVIYTRSENFSSQEAFDQVYVVLKPITSRTLLDLVLQGKGSQGMTREAATAFRSALLGLKVMHDGGWVHRDLKPSNIGFIKKASRSVLLDTGSSKHINKGEFLEHRPGAAGTINYLAPEFEMNRHDHSVDIWSMGVVLYELTYRRSPWRFRFNPWRQEYARHRPDFMVAYRDAIRRMASDYQSARASPTDGYIHLGALFIGMVRFAEAPGNNKPRLNIDEVLQHPAWGSLLSTSSPQEKRQRAE
ncbi:kinase-like domain-containing protein [Xylaria scruposa]|nr:kinase-like domain-containing protein [Xylaria scruposa]